MKKSNTIGVIAIIGIGLLFCAVTWVSSAAWDAHIRAVLK